MKTTKSRHLIPVTVILTFVVMGLAMLPMEQDARSASSCASSRSDMVCVPAGRFKMGSHAGDRDEEPPHWVDLDEFLIDKYEVTFAAYKRCVGAGRCARPRYSLLHKRSRKARKGSKSAKGSKATVSKVQVKVDPKFPVVGVDWHNASKYCTSLGKRLPTEAEWEKAARGTDSRRFPWGNKNPTCTYANIDDCGKGIAKVGSYPKGKSPYGAMDMTGNVWEWVSDWYDAKFYSNPVAGRNPTGPVNTKDPVTGQLNYRYKVLRGGSYSGSPSPLWASYRFRLMPNMRANDIGFRCAMSRPKTSGFGLTRLRYVMKWGSLTSGLM